MSTEAQLYVNSSSAMVAILWWPISAHMVSRSLAGWLSCSPASDTFPVESEEPSSFPRLWLHACSSCCFEGIKAVAACKQFLFYWGNQGCDCMQAESVLLGESWLRMHVGNFCSFGK